MHSRPVGAQGYIFHTHTCSGQQTTPAGVVGGAVQCDSEVEWGPGTADQEDTNTPLNVLPHRPLEVLLTTLWCSAESSEQSVVPHTTHKHIIRTETAVCAHERGSGTTQHDSRHVVTAARTEGAALNTIRPSTQLVIVAPP